MTVFYGEVGTEYIKRLKAQNLLGITLHPAIKELRDRVNNIEGNSRLYYLQLELIQNYVLSKFNYIGDDKQFKLGDYWDTTAWMKCLLAEEDGWYGDCDEFGYAVLGILYHVFGYKSTDIFRSSCAAETGEPHFVAWAISEEGVYYQMENRIKRPRTVRYMRDLGYEYWLFSSMLNTKKWNKAPNKVKDIIYNTPPNLESEKPRVTLRALTAVDTSKTQVNNWIQIVGGLTTAIVSLATTVESVSQTTMLIAGIVLSVFGAIGLYLRAVTYEEVERKKGYNE